MNEGPDQAPAMPVGEGAMGQNAQLLPDNDGLFLLDDLLQAIDNPAIGDPVIP
jgi:hypothetical protein